MRLQTELDLLFRIEKEQNYLIIASVTLPSGDVPFDASQYDSDRGGKVIFYYSITYTNVYP